MDFSTYLRKKQILIESEGKKHDTSIGKGNILLGLIIVILLVVIAILLKVSTTGEYG